MNEATHTFKGHTFRVLRGTTHPEYSLTCFANEEADFRAKHWDIKPGEVVVDVGASYGSYALTAAACGAEVHAFEPEQSVRVTLIENGIANNFEALHVYPFGLWDTPEQEVHMASYAPHWPAGTISGAFTMRTLDSFQFPRVDWLKVDVEGAEAHVLRGAQETIARCKPRVIVEVHTFLDPKLMAKCEAAIAATGVEYLLEEVPRGECVMLIARPA